MPSHTVDEETPLLPEAQQPQKSPTPFPWRQYAIILLIQFAEPLTALVISPFVPQLIRDIGVTNGNETHVGFYVGLLSSSFYVMQALTVFHWSRLSDHIGRTPVVLIGLFGLSASMFLFGLSDNFWELVLSRSLHGALNGNVGVMKTMIVDITDATHLARAYAYMPIAWSGGATLGSFVGGLLARPVDRFDVFGDWAFFKKYPYFLACAVPATYTALAWFIAYLFLKETVHDRVPLGQWIKAKFSKRKKILPTSDSVNGIREDGSTMKRDKARLPLRALLTPRVLVAAGNYAALALLELAIRHLQPLFFATPVELGGLGLDPSHIGNILAVYGVLNGLFQVLFFADMHARFGSKAIYSVAVVCGIPAVLTFPLLNALARTYGWRWPVWSVVGLQLILLIVLNLGYACMYMYVAASAPTRASLGATNGVAQQVVSVVRAVGPASVTSLFAVSVQTAGRAWVVYAYLLVVVCVAVGASVFLPSDMWARSTD